MTRSMTSMTNWLDRFLPVVALSLALFLQGLVASGAAASMVVPGLVAPDGSALTLADVCNNTEDGRTGHCHACVHAPAATLAATSTLPAVPTLSAGRVVSPYSAPAVVRPEANSRFHTGPPRA